MPSPERRSVFQEKALLTARRTGRASGGNYELSLDILDKAGNKLAAPFTASFEWDKTAPDATFVVNADVAYVSSQGTPWLLT